MPLQKLQFRPGLNREGTDYSNEGGWFDGDKIRFRSGYPEKIGGWTRLSDNQYVGTARSLWNWVDLAGANYLGVGTSKKYYIEKGTAFYDITPVVHTSTNLGALLNGPFTATNGSSTITVVDGTYAPNKGDYFTISGAASLGGNITAAVLNQEYVVTNVNPGTNSFTFTAKDPNTGLPVTANASDTGKGGTTVVIAYQLPVGLDVYSSGDGWGSGPWATYIAVSLTNPFTATGTGITVLTVTQTSHGLTTGDYVFFSSIASNPCGVNKAILQQSFPVTVTGPDTYTIDFSGISLYPASPTTTSTTASGGAVTVYVPAPPVRGWGIGYPTNAFGQQLRLWTNDNFGQDLVFAPRGGSIYYWEDIAGFPRAKPLSTVATTKGWDGNYVPHTTNQVLASAIQRFVIAFGANSYVYNQANSPFNPMIVRWSDQENPYQWVPEVTNQSGEFRLTNGSYIVGARSTRQEILVWTDSAIYSMQYLGAPYVWGFQVLMDNISVMSPNAMITVQNVTYWMGADKFYMYSGRVETLPCALRQYIFNDINKDQSFQVFAGSNEGYNEVWWFYCSTKSNTVDKYIIYNYLDRVWYYGSMSRTAWLDSGIRQYPMAAVNVIPTSTLAQSISAVATSITLASTDSFSISGVIVIDTEQIQYTGISDNTLQNCVRGYNTTTAAAHTNGVSVVQTDNGTGRLLYHESAVDDVAGLFPVPIASYVQSSDFDIGDGHNFGFVWRILPDINFNGSNVNNPYVKMTVKPRRNSGTAYGVADNPTVTSSDNYTAAPAYTIQQFTGQVYTRLRGRQMSFRIESDGLGVAWQLGSPRIDIRNDGRR